MSFLVTNKLSSLLLASIYITSLLATTSSQRGPCPFSYGWTIYIYNGIQDSVIDAHVRSKDDDLGHHNLTFGSSPGYNFGFCENVFQRTLFTGDFTHGTRFVHFHVFDLKVVDFVGGGSEEEYTNVYWLLKRDGYYLSKENKDFDDPVWTFRGPWE